MFERITSIEQRARAIRNPIERLRFLRRQMGPSWPVRSTRGRVAPALAFGLALVLVSGVLVSGYEFSHGSTMPAHQATILAPAVSSSAVASQAPADTSVWIVDRTGGVDTYSNGLRVQNQFAVQTKRRTSYRVYPRANVLIGAARYREAPAGIVYHTTESDEAPFQPGQDRNLKRIGREVLLLVQQNRSYHFLIDRFGRVFRIVPEEEVAFHAGKSVWADDEVVYVGLNASFLAIAIETQTKAGEDTAPANAAQIYSARVLTQMLRNKYRIRAGNCVTHAQVSVNPVNGLIGYHTDWAANFPFLELGLGDNYLEPPASIVFFGFGYDPVYLLSTGARLLPGLLRADNQVRAQAAGLGLDVSKYKALLQTKYMQITKEETHNAN